MSSKTRACPVRYLDSFFNIDPETGGAKALSLNEKQKSAEDSLKEIIHANPFLKGSPRKIKRKRNMEKSEVLSDTPVKERITAGIKSVSAKKALVLERKKVREVKRLNGKKHVFYNKGRSWSYDSDVNDLYNNFRLQYGC